MDKEKEDLQVDVPKEEKKDNPCDNKKDCKAEEIKDENCNNADCKCCSKEEQKNRDDELKKLKDTIIEMENKVKYQQAELINYRKRKEEETANMLKFANQELILELIPIADNFERAIKLDDNNLNDELSKFLAGFKILYSHLTDTFKKFGVEEIETVGKVFDPMMHEALMTSKDEGKENDIILECLLKGYTLKGKVIRPAKVIVNKLD